MNIDALLAAARRETGLDDLGDAGYMERLARFVALDELLTAGGRQAWAEMVQRWLVNRLRMQRDFARYPEIRSEDVSDPLVILGMPRSGSTALQRMLSGAPKLQTLYTWQVMNPAPFPGEQPGQPATARLNHAKAAEAHARQHNAESYAAHAVIADEADEDTMLHWVYCQSIHQFSLAPMVGDFVRELRNYPQAPSYAFVADLYRYLQWQDGGKRGRRWVMKSPNHLGCIEEMKQAHPDAVFIHLVRDYRAAFASMCRLLEVHYQHTFTTVDPEALGAILLEFWAGEMACHRRAKARLGSELKMIEISYGELMRNPVSSIESAYAVAGMAFTDDDRAAIESWLARNPQGKHGKFEYDLARYGISAEQIDEVFGRVPEMAED